ncbi:thiopeptide-type bacteriocin biosynthesis protein [Dactylosporangium roseum]|uniref:Thiopeptide-type bacteriocin biosynthesis protein n=1 Tax=Dactylosporangium roseum TaxID=47989 RepID=A0ABY5ZGP0_9ACTN|nr:thiopeptide-type bacteriocin biosynthesis protein [Dactylosporangium roseum]UWZ39434.1 thiopeptide-type bacteriocin biosynthesis protein [Dactylosporangium roseum]
MTSWYAIHVYDYASRDELVLHVVVPVAELLRQRDARCFIVRYWSGGPHVRLRVDLQDDAAFAEVFEVVRRHAAAYFDWQRKPRGFDDKAYLAAQAVYAGREGGAPPDLRLVPHATVCPAAYHPEYGKYGGPVGVSVAETLFCRSTAVVLDLLPAVVRDPVGRRAAALAMMLRALRSAGLSLADARRFLDQHHRYWSGYVPPERRKFWHDSVRDDRFGIGAAARRLLDPENTETHVSVWEDAVRAATAVRQAGPAPVDVLHHFLHTHNNRLGIEPVDEAHLADLGRAVLDRVDERLWYADFEELR